MRLHQLLVAGALAFGLAAAGPGAAAADPAADLAKQQAQRQVQQPLNNAPVWKEVRSGQEHYSSVRGVETGVLIQSGGETWRQLRNGPITLYGGVLLCAVIIAIGLFYKLRGKIMLSEPPTGRLIERFNGVERFTHWVMAGSFCVLALTGLTLTFGKHVLLPVLGYTLFAWLLNVGKVIHNVIGPVFLLSVIVFAVMFAKDNLWRPVDALWIRKAGGLLSGEHVPSYRFNFGEKTWFWIGVVLLGLVVSASGLVLNFPNFQQGRWLMQAANVIHLVGALIVICLSLGHIYIGSFGMEGALESMRSGYVDETWAKEHHQLWYEEAKVRQVGGERGAPAGVPGVPAHS
jgi:formate dehydrogenase subunit gamma